MDIRNNFTKAVEKTWQNKSLALPIFITTILMIGLFAAFIFSTGFYSVIQYEQQAEASFAAAHANDPAGSPDYRESAEYKAEQEKIADMMLSSITARGIGSILICGILLVIISIYSACLVYVTASLVVQGKKPDWTGSMKTAWTYFGKFLWGHVLTTLAMCGPVLIALIISIALTAAVPVLGIIALIITIGGGLVYIIYMMSRLFFTFPVMFFEGKNSNDSIKQSLSMTQGRVKEVMMAILVLIAASLCLSIAGDVLGSDLQSVIAPTSYPALHWTVLLFFYAISALVSLFSIIFMLLCYLDFKKGKAAASISPKIVKKKSKKKKTSKRS